MKKEANKYHEFMDRHLTNQSNQMMQTAETDDNGADLHQIVLHPSQLR